MQLFEYYTVDALNVYSLDLAASREIRPLRLEKRYLPCASDAGSLATVVPIPLFPLYAHTIECDP